MNKWAVTLLGCAWVLAGCAGDRLAERLNAQIGVLTIDQAVMNWGVPAYERQSPDGTILVWVRREVASQTSQPYPAYQWPTTGFYGAAMAGMSAGAGTMQNVYETDHTLTLRFDHDGRLQAWQAMSR